ncbi:hypothetical protein [Cryobacterium cryoconiti]|uniref:Uncharacterized protein n=1 Tax=Cryobacterium cryoconiti TaxID=1259239 RepID=A0A4Y8K479_9MICO|nr:hypothetical protein [Cryobacterium cryoconiti]TFD33358.1 hypothetical protein E3T49_03515 [Cryobacterium cryoconiti]
MDNDSTTPPPPGGRGAPPDQPADDRESDTPVGDRFEEGETEVGPHPSLINLENWEESDLASAAGPDDTSAVDPRAAE